MASTSISRDDFMDFLRQSGLLSARQFDSIAEQLPDVSRGRTIARALVEAGLITKFQAELLLIGRTSGFFLGPYRILDQLGQGGMGRVYKAMHQTMKRIVALKVLAPNLMKTDKVQKLFRREVRAAAQLNHPNVVTAYDANEIDGRFFLAMEFVDGPNLDQLVRDKGPLPVNVACEIVRQAAHGLQAAHELGMVHRDIKPANLLVQKVGKSQGLQVKILDFGLARLHEPLPEHLAASAPVKENTVMGTPDFLSPEQARGGRDLDIRSDLYSLGCTFFFLLTGCVPFPGGPTLEKLVRHCHEPPPPIDLLRPDVPPHVAEVMRTLMAKTPEERYQTPHDLIDALAPMAPLAPALPGFVWAESFQPGPTDMSAATPTPLGNPEDAVALDETMPAGFAPTPLSGELSILPWHNPDDDRRRHMRHTLYWALGFVMGVLIVLGVLLVLLNQ